MPVNFDAHFLGAVRDIRRSGSRQGVSDSPSTTSGGPVSTSQPKIKEQLYQYYIHIKNLVKLNPSYPQTGYGVVGT